MTQKTKIQLKTQELLEVVANDIDWLPEEKRAERHDGIRIHAHILVTKKVKQLKEGHGLYVGDGLYVTSEGIWLNKDGTPFISGIEDI